MVKIAFRNIFRQKRRTILTVLTMLGGFALCAVSYGWSDGTYNNIIDLFTRNQIGHIQIHREGYLDRPSLYKTIKDTARLEDLLHRQPGVEAWSPRVFSAGLASVGDKTTGARILGVDIARESAMIRLDDKVTEGRLPSDESHEALVGEGLVKTLGADLGDTVVVVSQGADGSIANDLYTIVGTVSSGDKFLDQVSLYLTLAEAQELLVLQGRIHELAITCDDLHQVDRIAAEISGAVNNPDLAVATWKEVASSFYQAMMADKEGNWIMLFIIVLLVAVGVLNTVLMSVLERVREYGLLRAIGTSPIGIFKLVTTEVVFMALIGIALGCVVAFITNSILSVHGLSLTTPFTYGGIEFKEMNAEINARSFYIPAIAVFFSAFLVSIFPAVKAARTPPARAMRMN